MFKIIPSLAGSVLVAGGLALALAGCLPQVAPPYEGGLAREPTNLTAYQDEKAGIRMALPQGWVSEPITDTSDPDLKAQFKKEGTSARMLVYCQGAFVSRTALSIKPLKLIDSVTTSDQRLWPKRSMGGGNFDPEFSSWTGTVESGGKLVPMNFYIAWRLPTRFGGCKYALWTIVGQQEASQIEGDFLAIVRSLK